MKLFSDRLRASRRSPQSEGQFLRSPLENLLPCPFSCPTAAISPISKPAAEKEWAFTWGRLINKVGHMSGKRLLPDLTPGVYAQSSRGATGYLLFVRESTSAPGAVGTLM